MLLCKSLDGGFTERCCWCSTALLDTPAAVNQVSAQPLPNISRYTDISLTNVAVSKTDLYWRPFRRSSYKVIDQSADSFCICPCLQAFLVEHDDGAIDLVGNRTEGALLILLRSWGRNYKTVREQRKDDVANMYGFSSAKKMASVMLNTDGRLRLYNKVCTCTLNPKP